MRLGVKHTLYEPWKGKKHNLLAFMFSHAYYLFLMTKSIEENLMQIAIKEFS